jgi:hypothetical protein
VSDDFMEGDDMLYPDLAPGKHLVLDATTVADTYRLHRRLHQPEKDPPEPVLERVFAWEGDYVTAAAVHLEDAPRRYRMWYTALDYGLMEQRRALGRSPHGNIGEPQPIYTCYAESADGVRWERPALNLFPHPAGDNSIVFKGFSNAGGAVVCDPAAPPDRRYILVNMEWFDTGNGGVIFAFSPDGLRFRYPTEPPQPAIYGHSDCPNSLVYNPFRKVWMMYMRGWHSAALNWPNGKGNCRRRVSYAESPDLIRWSEPQTVYAPDELDTNDFYGMPTFRYGDWFFGQLLVYDEDIAGTIGVQLAFSRDGIRWQRLPQRPWFIPHGVPGGPGGGMVFPAQAPVIDGDSIFVYWNEYANHHFAHPNRTQTFRGRLRLDGFVSLAAGRDMGNLITRPFTLRADRLLVNAQCQGGRIVAELTEPNPREPRGALVPGFSQDDCDGFTGDSTAHALSWRGRSDLSALRGKRLMLRLALTHADLYSFTV